MKTSAAIPTITRRAALSIGRSAQPNPSASYRGQLAIDRAPVPLQE